MESAAPPNTQPTQTEKPPHPEGWHLEGWCITQDALDERHDAGDVLYLNRSRHWRAGQYRRAFFRFAFALFLFVIAIATVRSGLGVPNPGLVLPLAPQRLPEVALILGVVFVLRAAWIAGSAYRAPTQYRVAPASAGQPTLWQRRDAAAPWQPVVAVARAVVVSERWGRRGRKAEVRWGGLHLWPAVASQDDRQGDRLQDVLQVGKQQPDPDGETDLQRVGQQLAQALALPYHYLTQPAQIAEQRLAPSPAPSPADEGAAPIVSDASPFPAERSE